MHSNEVIHFTNLFAFRVSAWSNVNIQSEENRIRKESNTDIISGGQNAENFVPSSIQATKINNLQTYKLEFVSLVADHIESPVIAHFVNSKLYFQHISPKLRDALHTLNQKWL